MVDIFALSVSHGLLAIVAIRLLMRDDLDQEGEARRLFGGRRKAPLAQDEGEAP
jgi:hypothetical protein